MTYRQRLRHALGNRAVRSRSRLARRFYLWAFWALREVLMD